MVLRVRANTQVLTQPCLQAMLAPFVFQCICNSALGRRQKRTREDFLTKSISGLWWYCLHCWHYASVFFPPKGAVAGCISVCCRGGTYWGLGHQETSDSPGIYQSLVLAKVRVHFGVCLPVASWCRGSRAGDPRAGHRHCGCSTSMTPIAQCFQPTDTCGACPAHTIWTQGLYFQCLPRENSQ